MNICIEKYKILKKIIEYLYKSDCYVFRNLKIFVTLDKYYFSKELLKCEYELDNMCKKHKIILSNIRKDIKKIRKKEYFITLKQFFCEDVCNIIIDFYIL